MSSSASASGQTSSTAAFYTAVRQFLLDYVTQDNTRLSDILGEDPDTKLYIGRAADSTKFPYGTIRLETSNDGRFHLMRLEGQLEILLHGRPWTQGDDIEDAADIVEQAMYEFLLHSDGLAFCHSKQRATLPPGVDPADSEVYTVRLVFTLAIWPAYLTRLSQS